MSGDIDTDELRDKKSQGNPAEGGLEDGKAVDITEARWLVAELLDLLQRGDEPMPRLRESCERAKRFLAAGERDTTEAGEDPWALLAEFENWSCHIDCEAGPSQGCTCGLDDYRSRVASALAARSAPGDTTEADVQTVAAVLASRQHVGAYQGSPTDAVTDARVIVAALATGQAPASFDTGGTCPDCGFIVNGSIHKRYCLPAPAAPEPDETKAQTP